MAESYMDDLRVESDRSNQIKLPDRKVMEYIELLLPLPDNASITQEKNNRLLRADMQHRYFDAPDLIDVGISLYQCRFRFCHSCETATRNSIVQRKPVSKNNGRKFTH